MFFRLAIHMIFGFSWEGGGGGGVSFRGWRCHLGEEGGFLTILWLPFASYLQPQGYLIS